MLYFGTSCSSKTETENDQVCFRNTCINVELAKTPQERQKGLMMRRILEGDSGMLFIFEKEESHYFWMKNTLIPLDMIWFNRNKQVIFIEKDVAPCTTRSCAFYGPRKNSLYVLELNAGFADTLGIRVGDKARFILKEP